MSDQVIGGIVTVATAIVGVAIIAVLVGSSSQTSNVLQNAGSAFSNALRAAEAPVTSGFGGSNFGGFGAGNSYFG